MNRYEYADKYRKPPYPYRQVRFFIPGSGGSTIGVAEIQANYELTETGWETHGFHQYQQIHYNHIIWEKNEITWKGVTIGKVLEYGHGGGLLPMGMRDPLDDLSRIYVERYPQSE